MTDTSFTLGLGAQYNYLNQGGNMFYWGKCFDFTLQTFLLFGIWLSSRAGLAMTISWRRSSQSWRNPGWSVRVQPSENSSIRFGLRTLVACVWWIEGRREQRPARLSTTNINHREPATQLANSVLRGTLLFNHLLFHCWFYSSPSHTIPWDPLLSGYLSGVKPAGSSNLPSMPPSQPLVSIFIFPFLYFT